MPPTAHCPPGRSGCRSPSPGSCVHLQGRVHTLFQDWAPWLCTVIRLSLLPALPEHTLTTQLSSEHFPAHGLSSPWHHGLGVSVSLWPMVGSTRDTRLVTTMVVVLEPCLFLVPHQTFTEHLLDAREDHDTDHLKVKNVATASNPPK